MARQYLQDDGVLEPAITDPLAANTATAITNTVSNSLRYFLIPAYDARPGKQYELEMGGLITTGATGALTISPFIGTTSGTTGTTLGASIAQTVPATSLSGPVVPKDAGDDPYDRGPWRFELHVDGARLLHLRRCRSDSQLGAAAHVRRNIRGVRPLRQPDLQHLQDAVCRWFVDDAERHHVRPELTKG